VSRPVPGAAGLAWRQLRADPWVSLVLALLVALVGCVATIWPRAVLDMDTRQVDYSLGELSALRRDVSATFVVTDVPVAGSAGEPGVFDEPEVTWAPLVEGLERVRGVQPEPLRSLLQEGRFTVDIPGLRRAPSDPDSDIRFADLQYRVDPALPDLVTLVEGDWPAATSPWDITAAGEPVEPADPAQEILLSADAAEQLVWQVGEERQVANAPLTRLSGTYEPRDPDDPHWQHSPYGAELATFFDGNVGTTARAAAYLAPGNPGSLPLTGSRQFRLWFPLAAADVPGDQVGELTAQLNGLTAAETPVTPGPAPDNALVPELTVRFSSEVFDTLSDLAAGQRATASVLAVVVAGPVGVALAVVALGARLIVQRRRTALALTLARGGSDRQVRTVLAAEGAALGLPAAALGYVAAGLVVPGTTGWPEWLLTVLVGLVPAVALALSPMSSALREQRSDLGTTRSRARWVVEVAVVALAALAVWRLLDRGPAGVGADGDTGVDPLVAATPVLLALAACVVTLRLYPLPVHTLVRRYRARPSLTPFLGAARAVRDPAGGLVPALAVVLGVSVAIFSTVLAGTISNGAERAAWAQTGAQVRLTGPLVTEDLVETIGRTPGVAAVARVTEASRTVDLTGDATAQGVTAYIVDDTLADVHALAPLVEPLPPDLYAPASPPPVLTGGEVSDGEMVVVSGLGSARVVGQLADLPGVSSDREFVVVTRSAWESAGGSTPVGTVALVGVESSAEADTVADALAEVVPNALVETPQQQLDDFRAAPVTSGLTWLLAAAVGLTAVLTVIAILVVQLIGAPGRARVLAVLRTLGLPRRAGQTLTAWELGPLVATALVVGGVLGLAVPWLILQAVDVRGLTGGLAQPTLHLDPVALGLVTLGVVGTVALAVTVSAAIAGRTDLAQQLRAGEER
jgi:putative ABC transport system permease protein